MIGEKLMENEKITMFQAGMIFSVSVTLFVLFSLFNPFEDFYLAGTFGEIIPILIPAVAGVLIFGKKLKTSLSLNFPGIGNVILAMAITILIMPVNMLVNAFNMWLVKIIFGRNISAGVPVPENGLELLMSLLVIGLVAAVCEEILFRGALQSGLAKMGKAGMFITVSVIFAAFHFNIEQFLGIFTLSLFITYFVYRTNSVFTGIAAHFTNNATAVLLSYYASGMAEMEASAEAGFVMPSGGEITVLIVLAALFMAIAGALIYVFHRRTMHMHTTPEHGDVFQIKTADFVSYLPGAIVMGAMFLLTIAAYLFVPADIF